MINFDIEKKGYNKEQVTKYFERVQREYEALYSENQTLQSELREARRLAEERPVYDIPPERLEAIGLALVDAETEAQRIVNTAREKAWQIITDAKKGLPVLEERPKPYLPAGAERSPEAAPQPQKPAAESFGSEIDDLMASILSKIQSGGD